MYPDKKVDQLIERLKLKIETAIIVMCIVLIVLCCVYAYIVRPVRDNVKSTLDVGYEKFKSFSLPLGDTTATTEYNEETVKEYTDDWGIRYTIKQRIK